jgi:hypothetical protein
VPAIIQAVHAKDTFIPSDPGGGAAGAFAVFLAKTAINTFIPDFTDSPQGKTTQHRKKCACRTDKPAVKTGYHQI